MNNHNNADESGHRGQQDVKPDDDAVLRLLDRPLTAEDLGEATERVATPLEPPEKNVIRLLVFQAGDERLAVEAVHVAKVTHATAVHRIPHRTNKIVRGLCNVDGELLLCADLGALLQLNETVSLDDDTVERQRMIVLGKEARQWVITVAAIDGVVPVVPDAFKRPPITVDAALGRYTSHLVPVDGNLVTLLDVERLLAGFEAALS